METNRTKRILFFFVGTPVYPVPRISAEVDFRLRYWLHSNDWANLAMHLICNVPVLGLSSMEISAFHSVLISFFAKLVLSPNFRLPYPTRNCQIRHWRPFLLRFSEILTDRISSIWFPRLSYCPIEFLHHWHFLSLWDFRLFRCVTHSSNFSLCITWNRNISNVSV